MKNDPYEEGCLSFPEHFAEIDRPDKLTIEYLMKIIKKKVLLN
jgi:peptide deformylase